MRPSSSRIFEASAELRADEICRHVAQDTSGNIYSTPRTERQREVAGDRAKHRAEHIDGGAACHASALDSGPCDLGGAAPWQGEVVQRRERLVEIFQSAAGKNVFGRDMSQSLPQKPDDSVLPRRTAGHGRMAAFARKHEVSGCVRYAGGHSKTRAGAQCGQRRARDRLPAAQRE
jgi:hypothetical protein